MKYREKDLQVHFLSEEFTVPAETLHAVKTVFMDLFCTPKSSMKNPSLRPSEHGGSTSRTFIVEDYSEDEYGQWATDEAIGEQDYVDDERLFLDMRRLRVCLALKTVYGDDACTQAWFDYKRLSVFTQSVRRIGKNVELFNVST